jgi:hypothetical protein
MHEFAITALAAGGKGDGKGDGTKLALFVVLSCC